MSKRRALRIKLPKQAVKPVLLYRLVFASFTMRFMVLVMLGFFALQPVSLIFANEGEVSESGETATEVAAIEPVVDNTETTGMEVIEDTELNIEPTPEVLTESELIEETDIEFNDVVVTADESIDEDLSATTSISVSDDTASTTEVINDEVATTTTTASTTATSTEIVTEPEIIIEEPQIEIPEEIVATTTEPEVTEVNETPVHISDANRYQFAETECTAVADGSYYCSKANETAGLNDSTSLRSELDEEGDTEIYLTINREVLQLSNNNVNDDSPKYDAVSETVVWHRLVNGRYEIVAYDLDNKIETVLTNNEINDMEPDRSGEYTVWQRWLNNNWEIILSDGTNEKQITNNDKHDVAPSVRGEFVIWHTNDSSGARQVAVYEIETGLISEISDPEGGVVENPRFVLVYDTTFENGDVITKGYDFGSGEVVPLSSVPGDLPEELPEPDQTGETRALIQTKSTSREEGDDTNEDLNLNPNATSTATSSPNIIDGETNTIDLSDTPADEIVELTEYDLVITPYEANVSSSTQDSHSTSSANLVE